MNDTLPTKWFSVRIVSVDHYLNPPIPDLDVAFSEFRGSAVKQVPILRVFGATPNGHKLCLHVHGVFPYLYIPCEETNPEPKLSYMIANSIDKALNISLKQTHSHSQHVYKVTLVKGVPFYGYHRKNHQFFKVFFYNPSFVKRAADLLQSGAIMGMSYQPHEAHINYLMQFFIDFNLYGMSFMNIEYVLYRRKKYSEQSQCLTNDFNDKIYLPESVPFTSSCELEVDCLAQHILNRQEVLHGNLGVNPGLEALWIDEKQRNKDLQLSSEVLPTQSQVREDIPATETHYYHRKKLIVKLALNMELQSEKSETDMSLSILNDTIDQKVTTDKNSLVLNNSIYPAETPDESEYLNATNVMLHHPSSIYNNTDTEKSNSDCYLDVDEEIATQCSQKFNSIPLEMDSDDIELMQMLNDLEQNIENDSVLASQTENDYDQNAHSDAEDFSETLLPNDSPKMDTNTKNKDLDHTVCFINDSSDSSDWNDTFWEGVDNISQLDGAWEKDGSKSNKKCKKSLRVGLSKYPRKCKKSKDIIEEKKVSSPSTKPQQDINMEEKFSLLEKTPKKKIKSSPCKTPRNFEPLSVKIENSPSFRNASSINSDATSESGTPKRKRTRSVSKLKLKKRQAMFITNFDENPNEIESLSQKNKVELSVSNGKKDYLIATEKIKKGNTIVWNDESKKTSNRTCISPVDRLMSENELSAEDEIESSPILNIKSKIKSTKTFTASQYDKQNNYIPQPGPSKKNSNATNCNLNIDNDHSSIGENLSLQEDRGIISFYNTTIYQDSTLCSSSFNNETTLKTPSNESELSKMNHSKMSEKSDSGDFKLFYHENSPEIVKINFNKYMSILSSKYSFNPGAEKAKEIILTPAVDPPSCNEVLLTMDNYNIPRCRNIEPFYSNNKDVGAQIEIGHIVLKLKSKCIEHLKDFPLSIPNNVSLNHYREKIFMESNGSQINLNSIKDLDLLLSTNRRVVVVPVIKPPSSNSVKKWLVSKQNKNIEQKEKQEQEIVSEKIQFLMPSSPGQDIDNSQLETISLSPCSLTPLTPECPTLASRKLEIDLDTQIYNQTSKHNIIKRRKSLCPPLKRRDSLHLSLPNALTVTNNGAKSPSKSSQDSTSSDILICGQKNIDSPEIHSNNSQISSPILKGKFYDATEREKSIQNSSDTYTSETNTTNNFLTTTNAFKFSGDNYQNAAVYHENEYLTVFVLEVLTSTRGDYNPDPQLDQICAIFYSILNDCPKNHTLPQRETGIIMIDSDIVTVEKKWSCIYPEMSFDNCKLILATDEKKIFEELESLVFKWDPDILCGYEIEMGSWGYLFQRGFTLEINMAAKISRVFIEKKQAFTKDSQEINRDIKIIGRITLDVWRLLRHEIALTSYTFENVFYHVLHERIPHFSYKTISFWWNHPSKLKRSMAMEYYLTRVTGSIRIMLQLDLISRTSELARLFGIQWYEVLSRGSQFRVESMMIRLTRPLNYVLVSPSVQQRAAMKAPECLPLILEPESRFYSDPVLVLDFQSLYPSMIIAYNYCYSTCIGKVENMGKNAPFQFGATQFRISPNLLRKFNERDLINWSPCGVGFIKPEIRKGILPRMLQDILNTRFMVKKAMKKHKKDKTLQKILHNRQLGLKLIANVTYGYTAANFSGRMPCVEVADSVVSKGRETLERAIRVIENTPKWKAKVVYGDTDSVFVLLPGRSRDEAFDIGAEIADVITNDNPTPVKLKFEKVYQPCILQTKKRYVGYMYESKDQKTPEYDAKGIETVRRDGCPAVAKMLEKTLRILFETYDVSKVKSFICNKFQDIIENKCNIRDFIFAREFRGMSGYRPTACVPALEIAKKLKEIDPRKEPREGERVPYVVINGAPGVTLLHLARSPRDLLADPSLKLNHNYYITRVIIPPLNRCLTLIGADVNQWFAEMPRRQLQSYPILKSVTNQNENKKSTISQYFSKVNCAGCDNQTTGGLCEKCFLQPQKTMMTLHNKMNEWRRKYFLTKKMCQSCCGRASDIDCSSLDCPILYNLNNSKHDIEQIPFILQLEKKLLLEF